MPKFPVSIDLFSTTVTDYAGPLFINTMPMDGNDGKIDRYVGLFTYTSTRAIHLEILALRLAFVASVRRFIGAREAP